MNSRKFLPGKSYVPVSGKVYGRSEINNAIKAAEAGWWTEGNFAEKFETTFKHYLGVNYVSLVNSGSSANLLALASLTSKVFGNRALKAGDEFVTTAVSFPTTVNAGILYKLLPVFVDSDLNTMNARPQDIEKAISPKTKLIMMAHTLGKPFDLEKVIYLVKKHNLWLIEDCCDALGTRYNGQLAGTFGHLATFSFYPAHHITMGEGGAVVTNSPLIHRSLRQFRDWGRDCWCDTGKDNTCRRRFQWQLGELPKGYDHKYTYSQIGFNLKLTDFQPAIGLAQMKRLPTFIKRRKENYRQLYAFFEKYRRFFILMDTSPKEDPSWFGFPLVVKDDAPFSRNSLTQYLEEQHIGTRNIFSGNLLRHPGYLDIHYRKIGNLANADLIMNNAFWLGVFPGIRQPQLNYVFQTLKKFLDSY